MYFAVGTVEQVIIYSTNSIVPVAVVGNIHYATINDLVWIMNGKLVKLAIASYDGYISFVNFELKEDGLTLLGEKLDQSEMPEKLKGIYESLESVNFKVFESEAKENSKKT